MSTTQERQRLSRVLIVEDDPNQLRTLSDIIEEEGFEVIGADCAEQAIKYLGEVEFGVAVVDLMLPDLSGTRLLEKIKEHNENIRVIIHTAYGSFDSAKDAVNLGAFAYVEKLGDPGELVRHVHRAFRGQLDRYTDELEERVQERTADLLKANRRLKDEILERQRADEALRQIHAELQERVKELALEVEERQKAQQELQRARDELELRVEERTADLTDANEKLQQEIEVRLRTEETLREEERLLKHMLDVHEGERKLIAYEIHDGLVQYLTGALMRLETLVEEHAYDSEEMQAQAELSLHLLREAQKEARRLIGGLRPPILDESGVVAAIEYLIRELQTTTDLDVDFSHEVSFDRLESLLESALFRIAQEALTNVRRHSHAERAAIALEEVNEHVRLTIQDWGDGFDPKQTRQRAFGLQGIRERARQLGGQASIESSPGEGTTIVVELPISIKNGPEEVREELSSQRAS